MKVKVVKISNKEGVNETEREHRLLGITSVGQSC